MSTQMPVDYVQKAIDLLEKGRSEQAAPLLEDVVNAFPAYAGAYVLLARAYESGERWTRALEAWRTALLLVPDSPVAIEGIRRSMRQGRRRTTYPAGTDAESASAVEALHQAPPPATDVQTAVDNEQEAASRDEATAVEASSPAPIQPVSGSVETRKTGGSAPTDDNLERLISELEGARITPRPDLDDIPAPEFEDDIEDMVSETLARIYASQGQFDEAARVYDTLATQHPERRVYFQQKALEMRSEKGGGS